MAGALGLERYAVLGHSYGAFIALQHAVDFPGRPAATIVSSGIPDARFLAHVEEELAAFEPVELREQVQASWAREAHARTQEDVAALLSDQLPFHFADPRDPRIDDLRAAMGDAVYGPDVLRAAATEDYGAIAVEDRLAEVAHPVLVLAGRHDRTCSVAAAEAMAERPARRRARRLRAQRPHGLRRGERGLPRRGARLPRAPRAPAEAQPPARTSAAAASACSSWSRTSSRPCAQKDGSSRSSPAMAASSSGLREPPAPSSSR